MFDKFRHRSDATELLDAPNIPKEILFTNLHELEFINRILGGNRISLNGIKKIVTNKNKSYHIVDLGCGGGGLMKQIAIWARSDGYSVKLTGVDKNSDVIHFMDDNCMDFPEISGVATDYDTYLKTGIPIDIVHCSLFCHHLKNDELNELFKYIKQSVSNGFVINDLHRSWFAYYGVKIFTFLFNGSVLSKNDGPISILRAFKLKELNTLLQNAHIKNYSIKWKWAFRYLITGYLST
jgi:2-polyprenyl-3-methyl-5-hydroxy-6-metoxy-1,4-benzoquinol methylase